MRSAQSQASNAATAANSTANTFKNLGQQAYGPLFGFLNQELNAQHTLSPQQEGELMTAAEGGAGGAASSLSGEAGLRAARTRNSAGLTGLNDSIARSKEQALAKAGEGIAAQDVNLTERNKQAAARGLQGLYGTDTTAMLRSMGLIPEDVNSEVNAGKSGWFQNIFGNRGLVGAMRGGGG